MEMKTIRNKFFLMPMVISLFGIIFSCGDDSNDPEPVFAEPTLTISSPDASQVINGVEGETITFSLSVTAEAGLSSVKLNGSNIKTYTGTETSDDFTHDYVPSEIGEVSLLFEVEDIESSITSFTATLNIEKGQFLILDLGGDFTTSETKFFRDWDTRTVFTFDVTGTVTNQATVEIVATQAEVSFSVADPLDELTKVMQIVKIPDTTITGITNWGGWPHIIYNLGTEIPKEEVDGLPTWDSDNLTQINNGKSLLLDAYYDDTADPDFNWDDLITVDTEPWGADPSLGYKVQLGIGKYGGPDDNQLGFGGHNGEGYYIIYYAYIDKPNEWVTLEFKVDENHISNFYPDYENSVSSDEIDAVRILPSGGYEPWDSNPLYLKNLRIVDAE